MGSKKPSSVEACKPIEPVTIPACCGLILQPIERSLHPELCSEPTCWFSGKRVTSWLVEKSNKRPDELQPPSQANLMSAAFFAPDLNQFRVITNKSDTISAQTIHQTATDLLCISSPSLLLQNFGILSPIRL